MNSAFQPCCSTNCQTVWPPTTARTSTARLKSFSTTWKQCLVIRAIDKLIDGQFHRHSRSNVAIDASIQEDATLSFHMSALFIASLLFQPLHYCPSPLFADEHYVIRRAQVDMRARAMTNGGASKETAKKRKRRTAACGGKEGQQQAGSTTVALNMMLQASVSIMLPACRLRWRCISLRLLPVRSRSWLLLCPGSALHPSCMSAM